jgi:hypothetical protein
MCVCIALTTVRIVVVLYGQHFNGHLKTAFSSSHCPVPPFYCVCVQNCIVVGAQKEKKKQQVAAE